MNQNNIYTLVLKRDVNLNNADKQSLIALIPQYFKNLDYLEGFIAGIGFDKIEIRTLNKYNELLACGAVINNRLLKIVTTNN